MKMRRIAILKLIIILLALLFMACIVLSAGTAFFASANENYAEMKGFNVSGDMWYVGDLDTEREAVQGYANSVSLWSSRYSTYDVENDITYILVLAEAKITASGRYCVNRNMQISIRHQGEACNIISVAPMQQGGTVNITSGASLGMSGNGPEFGISYQTAYSYPEISYSYIEMARYIDSKNHYIDEVVFNVDFIGWNNPSNAYRSPYMGTIVQKMSVIFAIENASESHYDSDYDTTIVEYTGSFSQVPILSNEKKTIKHTIADRNKEVDVYSLENNSDSEMFTNAYDVITREEIY